jgi:hypothetical protein
MEGDREAVRLAEYAAVVSQFRTLAGARFKLLGLLPLGTLGAILLIGRDGRMLAPIALFGTLIALGLFAYQLRNDQLQDELVSRAAQIERELGLYEGSFLQRPGPWHRLAPGLHVEHGWPVRLVYGATIGLWLTLFFDGLFSWVERGSLAMLGAIPAALLSGALVFVVGRTAASSRERYSRAVKEALDILVKRPIDRPIVPPHDDDLQEIADILRRRLGTSYGQAGNYLDRLKFYLADGRDAFLGRRQAVEGTWDIEEAARLLAQTIDMPARWIFDVYSKRR